MEAFVSLLGPGPGDRLVSVRTIEECVDEVGADVTVQTSCSRARIITGNEALRRAAANADQGDGPASAFFDGQDAGNAPAPRPSTRTRPTALEPNVQGKPGRPARPADPSCGWPRPPAWAAAGHELAVRKGLATPYRSASRSCANESAAEGLIRASPARCWPAAAKTGWCSTCRPPWPRASASRAGAKRRPQAAPSSEAADAALLLGGQGRGPVEHRSCCSTSRSASCSA